MSKALDHFADLAIFWTISTHPDDRPKVVRIIYETYAKEMQKRWPDVTPERVVAALEGLTAAMDRRITAMQPAGHA